MHVYINKQLVLFKSLLRPSTSALQGKETRFIKLKISGGNILHASNGLIEPVLDRYQFKILLGAGRSLFICSIETT